MTGLKEAVKAATVSDIRITPTFQAEPWRRR
jgi:hypothetical protein